MAFIISMTVTATNPLSSSMNSTMSITVSSLGAFSEYQLKD